MVSSLYTFLRNKAFLWSLGLCVLILPFQIKVLFFETQWGHGLANPYTSIFISAFDAALLLSSLSFIFFEKKKKVFLPPFPLILFLSLAGISLLFSPYQDEVLQLLLILKLVEMLLFYSLLQQTKSKDFLIKIFIGVMSVQSVWALAQLLLQQDFGLQIIGESVLTNSTANLARFTIGSMDLIRGYGSFPHPNILGGFLALSIFLCFHSSFQRKEKNILLVIQSLGLLATFSRSALLALFLVLLFTREGKTFFQNKKIYSMFVTASAFAFIFFCLLRGLDILNDPALLERLQGYGYAWEILKVHPFGVGFSHFTLFLDELNSVALQPWEYQPVHNIFILSMAELGIPLFVLLGVTCCVYSIKEKPFLGGAVLILGTIGLFDHYLLTQDQGRFFFILALSLLTMKEVEHHKTSAVLK